MTLKSLFAIPIIIVLIVTLSLAGMIVGQGWSGQARGRAAVGAVDRLRLLIELQTDLRAERLASNYALAKPYPMSEQVRRRLSGARRDTDRGIATIAANLRESRLEEIPPDHYLTATKASLARSRAEIDALLVSGPEARTFTALNPIMPGMLSVARLLDDPLEQASLAVTAADPGLSGLVTEVQLSASLRDQVGLIAAVVLPRVDAGGRPTDDDLDQVGVLLARAAYLTSLIADTIEVAGATEPIRKSLGELRSVDVLGILGQLNEPADSMPNPDDATASPIPRRLLLPWGAQINTLRTAIVDAIVQRADASLAERERRFDLVMVAFGAVIVAILESAVLLSLRVVQPLAHLGAAITRIAAGDRGIALRLQSGSREITEMVTAVETLRHAALVADAATVRQRLAARQRLEALRQALGIVQAVREPARALERDVASLCEGIDATIALVTTPTTAPPATLGAAAVALRQGLADIRGSALSLEATFAAASSTQTEDWPEAEFVAHILAVKAEVDRRDATVRGFVQPSLVALRDARSVSGEKPAPMLRDLVLNQFEHIETTVATVAAMLAAVTRATTIVRDLPLEDAPMAA